MSHVDVDDGVYDAVAEYVKRDRIRWRSIRQFVNEALRTRLEELGGWE